MPADDSSRTSPAARPPHPATIQRKAAASPKAAKTRGPHPATIQRKAKEPSKPGKARGPHPATVQRVAGTQRSKTASSATGTAEGSNKNTLLKNLEAARGKSWVMNMTKGLKAIVGDAGPSRYDFKRRIVFIDSQRTESEATQQLVMELSRHQNRVLYAKLDRGAAQMSRDEYIEQAERLEFAGVTNTLEAYNAAVRLRLGWAKGECICRAMGGLSFEEYCAQVSNEQREGYGQRYDEVPKK